ncbi:glutamate receptor ionotropic, delta-1-like [Scylla paramamosain]|uniref:glutamate receptor ionotropic, delta-1-like n=1 Tax=Scylla paramamosain TaxID=85552 RepID=UPI0030830A76
MRLMSWCTLVVVFSDNPTFLSVFAEMADEGRLMVWETRLLVITRIPLSNLQDLLQNYWTFSMMNTMFLKLNTSSGENHCQIYVHMPYSPAGSQVVQLASLKSGHTLVNIKERTLFPEKFNNFYGMKINLTWVPTRPYWNPVKQPGPNGTEVMSFTGREYLLMQSFAMIFNFTLNPLPWEGWPPVMRRLRTREAFLWPANLPILPHMLKQYDFSIFLERSTLGFTMAKPSIKPSWQSLYHPLRIEVWILILPTVIMVYIALMVMNQTGREKGPDAWIVMKQVLGTLLDEAIPGELPLRSTTRVVLTAWLLFSFIVGTVYRSNLTASLTIPKYPPRIETFSGLVEAETKILVVEYMDMFYNNFRQSTSEVLRTIAARMEIVPNEVIGISRCLTENAAYLFERLFMEVKIDEHFTDLDETTPFYVTQGSLLADLSAFLMIRDAPFKPNFDYVLITFHGAGIIQKLHSDSVGLIRRQNREKRRREKTTVIKKPEEKIKALTLVHMQGPFLLYLVCTIVSLVSFCSEVSRDVYLRSPRKH